MIQSTEFAIIGAGVAGLSIGWRLAKSGIGSNNPHNVVGATMDALSQLRDPNAYRARLGQDPVDDQDS